MVSVLLPTANRPEMLRTALRSIAQQSARGEIVEILVSENGGNRLSGQVCAEFPSLPITYLFREKPLPPIEHAYALFRAQLKGEFTAMLHDDDWWAPEHLERALQAFRANPDASVYHSSHFAVASESSPLGCSNNFFLWFGADYPPVDSLWILDRQSVLLASLLGTGASYSSLVAKTKACAQVAEIYKTNNPFDNDRMLTFALTAHGPLLYQPRPSIYYRHHPGQDTHTYANQRRTRQMIWTTEWIMQQAGGSWQAIGDLFADRAHKCPEHALPALRSSATEVWCLPTLLRHLPPHSQAAKLYQSYRRPSWKLLLKQMVPPVLFDLRYRWMRRH